MWFGNFFFKPYVILNYAEKRERRREVIRYINYLLKKLLLSSKLFKFLWIKNIIFPMQKNHENIYVMAKALVRRRFFTSVWFLLSKLFEILIRYKNKFWSFVKKIVKKNCKKTVFLSPFFFFFRILSSEL